MEEEKHTYINTLHHNVVQVYTYLFNGVVPTSNTLYVVT